MRIRYLLIALLLAVAMVAGSHSAAYARQGVVTAGYVAMFDTEQTAQSHCPRDVVVWLNTKTGIWHEKGMRWYGRTKNGAYVCRAEAAVAGYRDTENGQ